MSWTFCGFRVLSAVFPHFIMTVLPPGLAGLVVSGVFAAANVDDGLVPQRRLLRDRDGRRQAARGAGPQGRAVPPHRPVGLCPYGGAHGRDGSCSRRPPEGLLRCPTACWFIPAPALCMASCLRGQHARQSAMRRLRSLRLPLLQLL